jgi:general L-amino acid transport system substrate-binding protein
VEVEVEGEVSTVTEQVAVTFEGGGDTLATIIARDSLKCGGNATLGGFGFLDADSNEFSGFDVDFCAAIAAAVLGDAEKVEVTPTTGTSRFPTLQSGEVDVLIRNTTWTLSRDTSLGFDFGPINFYDGQGMMVRADSGITTLEDMAGSTVCVQAGTTTEKNLADVFRALDIPFTPAVFPDNPSTTEAYKAGQCDGLTTDKSGLVSIRINQLDVPEDHVILDVTMSKEPLGPLTRHGDNNWNDIVSWVMYCTFQAEESDVTSANVDDMLGSDDPTIQNLLGVVGDLGQSMGIPNDFCYQAIKQVGNYGEIYDRNLGPDTPFNLPRGLNEQYYNGGLIYSMPFR